MNLEDGGFKTGAYEGMFNIIITEESDCSLDGGHTFEDITNVWELNRSQVRDLLNELQEYLVNN